MASTLDTWSSAIIIQFDGTIIILIYNIFVDIVSLLSQEILGLDQLCQVITHSNKISLIWNIIVQLFFSVLNIGPVSYHGCESTSVNPCIVVHHKLCINIPFYIAILVYLQDQC